MAIFVASKNTYPDFSFKIFYLLLLNLLKWRVRDCTLFSISNTFSIILNNYLINADLRSLFLLVVSNGFKQHRK